MCCRICSATSTREVKAGQLCAKIDPRPYQSIVDQESAALGTARAQLAKDQANLAFAKTIYDRDLDLLNRRIVSQETVDTALNAWQQAQAQVALDESTIAQRVASLNSAKVNLDYTNIISPVNGTVVSRNVTQGQTVAASFQTPTLFLIATDLTQMQVDTNVSESDIGDVAVGNKVLFTVEAYPGRDVHRHRHASAAGAAKRTERHHLRRRRRRAESEAALEAGHDRRGRVVTARARRT